MNDDLKKAFVLALLAILGGVALIVAFSALFAIPTYYIWNSLIPSLFPLSKEFGLTDFPPYHITFLQAWGINLLAGFIFGGRISKK